MFHVVNCSMPGRAAAYPAIDKRRDALVVMTRHFLGTTDAPTTTLDDLRRIAARYDMDLDQRLELVKDPSLNKPEDVMKRAKRLMTNTLLDKAMAIALEHAAAVKAARADADLHTADKLITAAKKLTATPWAQLITDADRIRWAALRANEIKVSYSSLEDAIEAANLVLDKTNSPDDSWQRSFYAPDMTAQKNRAYKKTIDTMRTEIPLCEFDAPVLEWAEQTLDDPDAGVLDWAIAVLASYARRVEEMLKPEFEHVVVGDYKLWLSNVEKKHGKQPTSSDESDNDAEGLPEGGYRIPTLLPAAKIVTAVELIREKGIKYASPKLNKRFRELAVFAPVRTAFKELSLIHI